MGSNGNWGFPWLVDIHMYKKRGDAASVTCKGEMKAETPYWGVHGSW